MYPKLPPFTQNSPKTPRNLESLRTHTCGFSTLLNPPVKIFHFLEEQGRRDMKRAKLDSVVTLSRLRSLHFFTGLVFLNFLLIITQFPLLFRFLDRHNPPVRLLNEFPPHQQPRTRKVSSKILSNLIFREWKSENDTIYKAAMQAWVVGTELWSHLTRVPANAPSRSNETALPACPDVVSLSGWELKSGFVGLPCGLTIRSHITVVGRPRRAHLENETRISETTGVDVMVSQFMVELRRETAGGDGGPATATLLHFNPRIRGDWSGKPVIEMNNCYRGQWGAAIRCEGSRSSPSENTVDGQVKCEGWVRDDAIYSQESQAGMWLEKLVGQRKNVEMEWRYPFSEGKFFVLTITAGLEGYHISVEGRHVTSFAYRTGSDLEDAMLLYIYGDVDVHSVFVAALPTLYPNVGPERHLEMSATWKARPLPHGPPTLFIGVISAGEHFAERMAVRKSWMQHHLIRSSAVVARFFVAVHRKAGINKELKSEAEFFGDIVIVPYLDDYELVVLKTLAICEYGVNISAKYIMKCDDDTFVRVDAVTEEVGSADGEKSLYAGKINYYHKPLRNGKWAVAHEEWPGEVYPPYADGAGYIISLDIARFIMMEFDKGRLRLFKMEDVSMGMWVEQFNSSRPVEYLHSKHFHQSGCVDDYYTAHYQSPKQLLCLWEMLQSEGKAKCCNFG